jgi:exodeoxyribonuclease-3
MQRVNADVICLQETKATPEQVQDACVTLEGYHVFANSAERKGYSGTAILSKVQPLNVTFGIGIAEHDTEGRVVCAEYSSYFVVSVYVPNSGSELLRLGYRQTWDADFLSYLKKLESIKPVVVCGDFNVAHQAIDLARPKENYNKAAGYMQEEIDGMNRFVQNGLVDTFRTLNPALVNYSWWSYRAGAREKNVGWRIDYFLVSKSFLPQVKESFILTDVYGSDHCPVGIQL